MASHPATVAREAYRKGDYPLAERLFRSLCRDEPDQPVWHLDLATLCIALIRFDEASDALRLATAHARGRADILRQIALCQFSMYRFDEARNLLEPAAAAGDLPCLLGLLQVMEREGMIDETAERLVAALKRHPTHPELVLLQAQVLMRQGNWDAAEASARAMLAAGIPFLLQSKASYLLASVLDRTGRYSEAAAVLAQVKMATRSMPWVSGLQKEFRSRIALVRELAAAFAQAPQASWATDVAGDPLPFRPALLCGHPRSGTTVLEARIESLPNVIAFDETGAFDGGSLAATNLVGRVNLLRSLKPAGRDLALAARRHYSRALTSLHGRPFADRPLVVDKNPSQIIQLPLWRRLLPEARLLVALRDPRDVVVSSYFFDLPPNATSVQFLDWESTARHYAAVMDLWRQFRDRLPAECWMESRYEDMIADPALETARVAGFVGASTSEREGITPSTTRHSPNYATAAAPVHSRSVGRWHRYEEHFGAALTILDPFLRDFGYED